ncbi:MAG: hypothetical protein JW937_01505 [Candidatus Omnitrophica bacterium]|nr:hypothetical protein [Candidatus Omnitrophota bacterium]
MRISLVVCGVLFVGASFLSAVNVYAGNAPEGKKVSVVGQKPDIAGVNFGAVTYISRTGESAYSLSVTGDAAAPSDVVLVGENHDSSGNLTGVDDSAGVATDLNTSVITITNAVVSGSTATQGGITAPDLSLWISYFRQVADVTLTMDTTYASTTIGSAANYQIVYVDDAQITLQSGFEGFGVLAIEDKNPGPARAPRLVMEGDAKWTGLVFIFQEDVSGSANDVSRIKMLGTPGNLYDLADFVFLAKNGISIDKELTVVAGFLGVNNPGGTFVSDKTSTVNGDVIADSVTLGKDCVINGDLHYNSASLGSGVVVTGTTYTSMTTPFVHLPVFPSFSAGVSDVNIGASATLDLAPGSYKDVNGGMYSTLRLTGGVYYFEDIYMAKESYIYYEAPAEVHIKGNLDTDKTLYVGPAPASGLGTDDVVLYVEGSVPAFSKASTFLGTLYAPNANLSIDKDGVFQGQVISNTINMDKGATVVLDNTWFTGAVGSGGLRPQVLGGLLLVGREFFVPDGNTYCDILYSSEVLDNVETAIESRPHRWMDWREAE